MRHTWKFPALVRGIAPKSGEERHCLVAGSAEFEIREVDISRMPMAFKAERHEFAFPIEYRLLDGVLYKSEEDYDDFEREMDGEDLMAYGSSMFYRRVADEIIDIMKSGTVIPWPMDAHLKRDKGARDLETTGVVLLPGGESDLAYWRSKFGDALARIVLSDGRVWTRVGEPVFCVSKSKGVNAVHMYIDDASIFTEKRTEWGTRQTATSAGGGAYRIFSIADRAAALRCLDAMAADLGIPGEELDTIEIFMPEAVSMDIDRLEMDRLARVCVAHIGKAFTKVKPGGGETLLEIAPSALVMRWVELKELLKSYRPTDGIPETLETQFNSLITETDAFAGDYGPVLIPEALRNAISYSLDRWDNRVIDVGATATFAAG
ncbi:hypothetical protein [Rhizobium sp. BK176]|uniref:hypothetical protein n=1 Tax=Rhizobium sp. BK176 TaxID=2587071 RepID=UPI002167531C|nr:hypothetical protein [Rhizobium sp. BK176]MCS4089093.1 hypothetical protein [Rhizobium sp. BK176]